MNKPAADGGVNVYRTTVTLEDGSGTAAGNAAVTLLGTSAGYSYGLTDMKTDADGKLYLYLPENTLTTVVLTTDGAAYTTYRGSVQTSSSGAASGSLISGAAPPTQVTFVDHSVSFTSHTLGLATLTITGIGAIDENIATATLDNGR